MISRLKFALGFRHLQVAMIFLSIILAYTNRYIISVCMVAMTTINNPNPDFPTYNWNSQQRSYIMSSYMWGYAVSLLGGYLSHHFGTKIVIALAAFVASTMLLLVPIAISWAGWQIFIVLRLVQGLAQGIASSAWDRHLAQWCSPRERTFLVGLTFCGIDLGCLLITAMSGVIVSSSMGWPGAWYICGGTYLLWNILWLVFASSNPSQSRWISAKERSYIETSLQRDAEFHKQKIPIPWQALLSSKPVLAYTASRILFSFCGGILNLFMPAYKNSILKMDIESVAFYSSLTYVGSVLCCLLSTALLQLVLQRKWLSLSAMRKGLIGGSLTVTCACLVALCLLNASDMTTIIVLSIVATSVPGITNLCLSVNALELACNHASIVSGIGLTLSTSISMLGPLFVGVVVVDETNIQQWNIVFASMAALLALTAVIFIIWGSSTLQPWDDKDFMKKAKKHSVESLE